MEVHFTQLHLNEARFYSISILRKTTLCNLLWVVPTINQTHLSDMVNKTETERFKHEILQQFSNVTLEKVCYNINQACCRFANRFATQ